MENSWIDKIKNVVFPAKPVLEQAASAAKKTSPPAPAPGSPSLADMVKKNMAENAAAEAKKKLNKKKNPLLDMVKGSK